MSRKGIHCIRVSAFVFAIFSIVLMPWPRGVWASSSSTGKDKLHFLIELKQDLKTFRNLNTSTLLSVTDAQSEMKERVVTAQHFAEFYRTLRREMGYARVPADEPGLLEFNDRIRAAIDANAEGLDTYAQALQSGQIRNSDDAALISAIENGANKVNDAVVALNVNISPLPSYGDNASVATNSDIEDAMTYQNRAIQNADAALDAYRHVHLSRTDFDQIEDQEVAEETSTFRQASPIQNDGYLRSKGFDYENKVVEGIQRRLRAVINKMVASIGSRLEAEGLMDYQSTEVRYLKEPSSYRNQVLSTMARTKRMETRDRQKFEKALYEALQQMEHLRNEMRMLKMAEQH